MQANNLVHAFIQSDLQCIQAVYLFYQYACSLGFKPMTFTNAIHYQLSQGHKVHGFLIQGFVLRMKHTSDMGVEAGHV